jgi:hypothetical protein
MATKTKSIDLEEITYRAQSEIRASLPRNIELPKRTTELNRDCLDLVREGFMDVVRTYLNGPILDKRDWEVLESTNGVGKFAAGQIEAYAKFQYLEVDNKEGLVTLFQEEDRPRARSLTFQDLLHLSCSPATGFAGKIPTLSLFKSCESGYWLS